MEKRISFRDFQSVKSVAKAMDPKLRERNILRTKLEKIAGTYKKVDDQINLMDASIFQSIGMHVSDLVEKTFVEDSNGNKVAKYMPTSIVSYDDQKKQYVVTIPDNEEEEVLEDIPAPMPEGPEL